MAEKTYNIVITGNFINGVTQEAAVASFASTFKLTSEKAEAALAQAPKVIKAGVEESKAKVYVNTLSKMGIEAKSEATGSAALISKTPVADSHTQTQPANDSVPVNTPPATAEEPAHNLGSTYKPENPKGLNFRVEGKPDYSFLTVEIPANKTLKVEASAMATMDTHIKMKTKLKGGFGRLLTGENIFINEFTAEQVPGEIGIAPGTPGDLNHRFLEDDTIFLQNSAFVASSYDVAVETKWQGLVKGFFSGESLFLIRCSGTGDLWFNTYGAIIEIDVNGAYVVDTGNIVAFTEGLEYRISKVGGYKSLFFSGEGFVCKFSGSGKVWIQTRSASAFTQWAHWYRPVSTK